MSRLPALRFEDLDAAGQALWVQIVDSRGDAALSAEGSLTGPFNVWVSAPDIGAPLLELGTRLRFNSHLEPRLLELAIVTIAARWQAEFEWWAHTRRAREHGIAEEVLEALAAGEAPSFTLDDERVVHAVANELATGGKLDKKTYDAATAMLGRARLVELVTLCGYYTSVSFTLNAFGVELPPGVAPAWR
jgi:4-carboxymuconolactone decarboxylase